MIETQTRLGNLVIKKEQLFTIQYRKYATINNCDCELCCTSMTLQNVELFKYEKETGIILCNI